MNSKTAMYIVKRLLMAIITIAAVITITFFVMQALPGSPFLTEKGISDERLAALNRRYGLDKPVVVQWLKYLVNAFRFNFGISLKDSGTPVMKLIWAGFKVSAKNGLMAAAIAIIFGIFFGVLAAVYRGRWQDRLIMILSTAMVAVPSFVIAAFLFYWFCVKAGWFPTDFGLSHSASKYVLPVITLSLYPMAYIVRLTRTSTLDALEADYIRTARAKGVSPAKVLFKHALRNALIPVITILGPILVNLMTGTMVVEQICVAPGLGTLLIQSIQANDYNIVMACSFLYAFMYIIMMLIIDISYGLINGRL